MGVGATVLDGAIVGRGTAAVDVVVVGAGAGAVESSAGGVETAAFPGAVLKAAFALFNNSRAAASCCAVKEGLDAGAGAVSTGSEVTGLVVGATAAGLGVETTGAGAGTEATGLFGGVALILC